MKEVRKGEIKMEEQKQESNIEDTPKEAKVKNVVMGIC